jgi:conjugal transfer pilus assembly protein TraA
VTGQVILDTRTSCPRSKDKNGKHLDRHEKILPLERRPSHFAWQPHPRNGAFLFGMNVLPTKTEGNVMQSVLKLARKGEVAALAAVATIVGIAAIASPALAGADATFDTALNQFTGFLEGSGGKIITVLSLAGGIVGLASGRFSLAQVAIPVGVGVGAGTGIPIVTSTVTATI